MQLIPQSRRPSTAARWSPAIGLTALLVVSATLRWQLRAGPETPREQAPIAPTPSTVIPIRVTVSADGEITVDGQTMTPGAQGLTTRLSGSGPTPPVELSVDPRAPGQKVDELLKRLSDAGVLRITLNINPAATQSGVPTLATKSAVDNGTLP